MAKTSKSINDFSGGLATGIDPANLKDNQFAKCTGLVTTGSGKLGLVCDEVKASTSSVNTTLPRGGGKNIHAWSSDEEFTVAGQPTNIAPPSVGQLRPPMVARLQFYITDIHPTSNGYTSLGLEIKVNGERILLANDYVNQAEKVWSEGDPHDRIIINPAYAGDTSNSNYYEQDSNKESYMAIHYLEYLVYKMLEWKNGSNPGLYPIIPQITTDYTGDSRGVATQNNFGTSLLNNDFYVTRHTALTSGSWGPKNKYSIKMYWENYKNLDLEMLGSVFNNLKAMADNTTFTSTGSDGNSDTYTAIQAMPYHEFDSQVTSFANGSNTHFMYLKPTLEHTDYWGHNNSWIYSLANVNTFTEIATYGITIKYYTNYLRTTFVNKSYTYQAMQGDTSEQILNGIFGQLPDESEAVELNDGTLFNVIDHKITPVSATGARYLFQSYATKAYGFDCTATKTSVTNVSVVGPGRKFRHLVAVGGANSRAVVYSMENDNWLQYPIDLRETSSNTADNSVKLSFFDAEGYLRVSDSTLMLDNKPKWFGYFNADKLYENTSLVTNAGYFITDMAPTPHGYDADNTVVGVNALNGQATHIADIAHSMYKYTTDEQKILLSIPKYGTTNTQKSYMAHPQGVKLWYTFIDGTTSSQSATDILPGSFLKDTNVEFYWTYVYEGGYVSQPTKFRQWHTDSSLQNKEMSINPVVDNCSLGLGLKIGKQLLDGNGSVQSNVRLNGIEIWGKFKNTDPNNLYLMMEVDLNKGWKSPVTGEWQALTFHDSQEYITHADSTPPLSSCPIFRTIPVGIEDSFYSRYGISWDKPIGFESPGTGFKTACIFERRAYYGNIAIKGEDGQIHKYPDGIVKSLAGKYDTFSIDNLIEATVNDGDEITCLKVVGNKLCQFKKNSLAIMGIKVLENGQTKEVIEQIVHHVGVLNDNQVCETPFGLFWVSRSGMYLFNGEDIRNLTSNENGSIIDKKTWESFYGERTHCGYDAYWNQAHIAKEQENNETTLIYDFNTTSFSEVKGLYNGSNKTGFVNDRHGHLLWAEEGANTSNLGMTGSSPSSQNNVATSATPALSGD